MKRRELAKSEVRSPTTRSQPTLAFSRAVTVSTTTAPTPSGSARDVGDDQSLRAGGDISEDEAGDSKDEDEQRKEGEEEVIGEQAGEVEDPVVVDLDPEGGEGGDTAGWRVAMPDCLVQICLALYSIAKQPPERVDASHALVLGLFMSSALSSHTLGLSHASPGVTQR
jgi:hypothetical protein